MPVVANSVVLSASLNWEMEKTNTGLTTTAQKGSFTSKPSINTTTYEYVYLEQFTLAASGTATKDLYGAWTNLVGESVTGIALLGYIIKATATVTGGQLQISDAASNNLSFALGGTSPTLTVTVGTIGATIVIQQGTSFTMSNTIKNIKFSNPGSQSITVTFGAIIGD